ncbi:MAG TPA: helix-turn-helix domain-containing protein, partial [Candidatus Limnocylindrales bacterium]
MATSDGDLDVRLLGPIEVLQGEQRLEIGGKRQRHLLALLALEGGRVVPTDRLVDELGAGSSAAIKVQISRLRKALGSAGPISGSAGGYRLEVPPEQVDVARFERFVVAAREHR